MAIAVMAAASVDRDSHSESAALLRERLRRLAATLDELDGEQLAAINDLVAMLERLTALLDNTADH
jgi:hypothetical protein